MKNNNNPQRLKIGVIGYGVMGRNHARLCEELKGIELGCIVEADSKRRALAKEKYSCAVFKDIFAVDLSKVDAFCVVVPTSLHHEIVSYLLANRKPCLIEKPLVANMIESQKLIDLQDKYDVPVLVGHIERFNPAYVQLERILRSETIIGIDVQRLSYSSSRVVDTDVILDLMIHDIDIVLTILGKDKFADISAKSYSLKNNGADYASTVIKSKLGKIITMTASRLTHNKLRVLQVTTNTSHIKVDYTDQKIDIYRKGKIHISDDKEDVPHYSIETLVEKVIVRHDEPLANELRHFSACVRGNAKPIVSARDATDALAMAYKIQEECARNN